MRKVTEKKVSGMIHRFLRLFLFVLMFQQGVLVVSAENSLKVVDMADLLDADEEEKLQQQFTELAMRYQCDIAVVTTDSCGGKSPQDYTDDFYEENGYGYGENIDGIMLMVSMRERKFHLSTFGKAIRIFTDYGLLQIDGKITPELSDGEYYDAFRRFGELADEFVQEYESGHPFDTNHPYREHMSMWARILISVFVGLAAAAAVFGGLFAQLRSVRAKYQAGAYVRDGSFQVTRARDVYLYRTVTRVQKPQERSGGGGSSTHTTSHGHSAGGRTGSF